MKKLLALIFSLLAFSAQAQVKISDLPRADPALAGDVVPMSNTSRSTSSSYILSVATISAYVLNRPVVSGGTATTAVPAIDIGQNWNNAAVPFTLIRGNATSSASATASKLLDLQVASTAVFSVRKDGAIINAGDGRLSTPGAGQWLFEGAGGADHLFVASTGTVLPSSFVYGWSASADPVATPSTGISYGGAAGVVAVGTGAAGSTAGAIVANAITTGAIVVAGGSSIGGLSLPALQAGAVTFNAGGSGGKLYQFWGGTLAMTFGTTAAGSEAITFAPNGVYIRSNAAFRFSSATTDSYATQTNISQLSAGVVGIGTTSVGSAGTLVTANIQTNGVITVGKTVTAAGTTGAQTINHISGSVNFAATDTSLVVTNSRVTANSIVICTVGTNDTTMKSAACVATTGTITMHANAAATAETRVNFLVMN